MYLDGLAVLPLIAPAAVVLAMIQSLHARGLPEYPAVMLVQCELDRPQVFEVNELTGREALSRSMALVV